MRRTAVPSGQPSSAPRGYRLDQVLGWAGWRGPGLSSALELTQGVVTDAVRQLHKGHAFEHHFLQGQVRRGPGPCRPGNRFITETMACNAPSNCSGKSPGTPAGPVHRDPGSAPARPGRCGRALLHRFRGNLLQLASRFCSSCTEYMRARCTGCGLRPPARWLADCPGGSGRAAGRTGRTFIHITDHQILGEPFLGEKIRTNVMTCGDFRQVLLV